jgi:hypothetical protein
VPRLASRQLNRRAQGSGAFVSEKSAAHAIDGQRHRRKVDDDLVGEAAPVWLTAGADRQRADVTGSVPTHE